MKRNISPWNLKKVSTLKKLTTTSILFTMLCLLLLSGCTKKDAAPQKNDATAETQITASFYPLYVMLMNITENVPGIKLNLMAPADTGCLHHYHLSPADMKLVQDTDIMVVNGAHMEEFMDKILDTLDSSSIVTATGDWPLIDENPHIWVSPAGAIHQVEQITAGLCALDAANSQLYQQNAANYIAKLQDLRSTMLSELQPFAGASLITFHEAFPYLAQEFNFSLEGSIEREPDSEPTAKELVETINLIQEVQTKGQPLALFAELNYASSAAEVIARETGLTVHQLDPAVTGILDKDDYLRAMEYNTTILKEALTH